MLSAALKGNIYLFGNFLNLYNQKVRILHYSKKGNYVVGDMSKFLKLFQLASTLPLEINLKTIY